MKGIDVSKHQGKVDWKKVKASGVEFAIIRAGVGMYLNQKDSCFKTNVAGAVAAGIPVGVYWYSYALTPEEGKREAEVCLQVLSNFRDKIALPVWFDMEDADHYKKKHEFAFTRQNITAICGAFLEPMRAAGYRCGVYASKSWLDSYIDVGALNCEVWAAHWASKCGYTGKN